MARVDSVSCLERRRRVNADVCPGHTHRPLCRAALAVAAGALAILLAGTGAQAVDLDAPGRHPIKEAPSAYALDRALYGPVRAAYAKGPERVRPMSAAGKAWRDAPFLVVQTELSPATLIRSKTPYLAFFTGMGGGGPAAPTFAAYVASGTPTVVRAGGRINPQAMTECWILVWFAGAKGWTEWDSPHVLYLQRRPRSVTFGADGLVLRFDGPAGHVVLLPLYGSYRPPQKEHEYLAAHGLVESGIRPWEWADGLPADVAGRIRYWANVLREFPIYCEDSFRVDRNRGAVTIRSRFEWVEIDDDWQTPHRRLAPVSPVLALASMDGRFPVTYSRPLVDPRMFTPYGPYMGVENTDEFDASLYILPYVHETEAVQPPNLEAHPSVAAALSRLRETARLKFPSADAYRYDHGGMQNFCWAIQGDQWYAKALPYMDDETRERALGSLQKYFHDDAAVGARFKEREFPPDSGRTYYILEGPGIGSGDGLGDGGKLATHFLETLWCYAHYTGDWDLVERRWELVQKCFCAPAETRWATFGRGTITELGDEAAPCIAYARMAWRVGNIDAYAYGCYMAARELAMHYAKQRGAEYFRRHQPWPTMEFMPEEVYLTNVWGDTAGWQIDGPAYPAEANERQYTNRWVRFHNEDVARFYRTVLPKEVAAEMNLLTERWPAERRARNDSHILPSLVQLRSLLLNESPEALSALASPADFCGPPSGVLASCLAVIRTSHPVKYQRLIPRAGETPFVVGLERDVAGPNPVLCQSVRHRAGPKADGDVIWPEVTWWQPGGRRWSFGTILPDPHARPLGGSLVPLNWNTAVYVYAIP